MRSTSRKSEWEATMFNLNKKDHTVGNLSVAVSTSQTSAGDRMNIRFFLVDELLKPVLESFAAKKASGRLQLIDDSGNTIAAEDFKPK